ncbi:MAG TPA: 4a-hydroxytetrahydrobiopterin dehydratase [Acidobacteriota bacterium]|nr:4a-hydroxytetrahydrobiopterin dehydratase [Acidobacteriota bacterium]
MTEEVKNLPSEEVQERLQRLQGWEKVGGEERIERTFLFPDFLTALAFVNRVAEIAEEQCHHPDIFLTWGKVNLQTWTHSTGGLTSKDFRLASAVNQVYDPE